MQTSIMNFKAVIGLEATPEKIIRLRDKRSGKFLGFIREKE